MDIPKELLNTQVDVFFRDGKKDRGYIQEAQIGHPFDYIFHIVVGEAAFYKEDVLEIGEGYIKVNFEGHETSPMA